jgi:hypothetical protein
MTGQCKYCRKHGVQVSQIDRHPDNTIIRNKQGESQGICEECELKIPSTKKELLEALSYLNESVHMNIIMRELLNILPEEGEFNHKAIYEEITRSQIRNSLKKHKYYMGRSNFDNLKHRIGYVVVAASRMKPENTPLERKQAAKSVFLRGLIDYEINHGMLGDCRDLEKEYGKWYNKV